MNKDDAEKVLKTFLQLIYDSLSIGTPYSIVSYNNSAEKK
jgi:hypothetical protein